MKHLAVLIWAATVVLVPAPASAVDLINPLSVIKGAVEGFVDDTVVETKINALLLDAKGVNVTNFRWRSVHGHVFLFGRALSDEEHKKATNVVKEIKDVVSVKNLAKIKPTS